MAMTIQAEESRLNCFRQCPYILNTTIIAIQNISHTNNVYLSFQLITTAVTRQDNDTTKASFTAGGWLSKFISYSYSRVYFEEYVIKSLAPTEIVYVKKLFEYLTPRLILLMIHSICCCFLIQIMVLRYATYQPVQFLILNTLEKKTIVFNYRCRNNKIY